MDNREQFKCPKCKKDILYLVEIRDFPICVEFYFSGKHAYEGLSHNEEDYIEVVGKRYFCPECKAKLFSSEDKMWKWAEKKGLTY